MLLSEFPGFSLHFLFFVFLLGKGFSQKKGIMIEIG